MNKKDIRQTHRLSREIDKDEKLLDRWDETNERFTRELERLSRTIRTSLGKLPLGVRILIKEVEMLRAGIERNEKLLSSHELETADIKSNAINLRFTRLVTSSMRLQRHYLQKQLQAFESLVEYLKSQKE